MIEKLKGFYDRYQEILQECCKPEVISDIQKWQKLSKEQSDLEEYANLYERYETLTRNIENAKEVLASNDEELKSIAESEIEENTEKLKTLEQEIKIALLPKDSKDDSKTVIIEVRSGAGGDESSLFGAELFNMYKKYAEKHGWKVEVTEYSETEVGGIRHFCCR